MTDEGIVSTGGVVRLLETEPTHEERYAHAFALLALLKPPQGPSTAQTSHVNVRTRQPATELPVLGAGRERATLSSTRPY